MLWKKFLIFCIVIFLFFGVFAEAETLKIHYFYRELCPACLRAEKFLNVLEEKYPEIKINRYLAAAPENRAILEELAKKTGAEKYVGLVPLTFIGQRFFLGFDSPQGIGREIENYVQEQLGIKEPTEQPVEPDRKISIPFFGEIDLTVFSLPALAVVLGFLDGFNVCSLGAIVLILSLVIGLRSRKKILLFGGLFILTTAVTYGFLMAMWSFFFALLGAYMKNMQVLIGGLAAAGAIFFFWQFLKFRKKAPVCEAGGGIKSKLTEKFQEAFKKPKNILLVAGAVLAFAFLVTVIEFPCSAVVPVIFTGILAQAQITGLLALPYITLFVLFYMLDEIAVFLVAVFTMRLWMVSPKFVTYATLAQAIILFLLGTYYLFGI
jgi:hypothetical protein